jgi:phage/plasmid-like protein (TIGR03299 family)
MAAELDMSTGRAAIAYVGEKPWHGLGQELTRGAPIEVWQKQAGMCWDIMQTQVRYNKDNDEVGMFPNQTVLYRSDTKAPLSIVSGDYKIVQPREVVEFFRDLVSGFGMELETAGCLFGGTRFWALANTNNAADIIGNDRVKGMLLLTTSCDRSRATTAQFTTVRVVCNNTLSLALDNGADRVKVTHSKYFDPMNIKSQLGVMDSSFAKFRDQMSALANAKVTDKFVSDFYYELVSDPKKTAEDQTSGVGKTITDMMNRYRNGMGADMTKGTAWGALNGVTEYIDHGGRGTVDHKLWNSWYGGKASIKDKAVNYLVNKFDLVDA